MVSLGPDMIYQVNDSPNQAETLQESDIGIDQLGEISEFATSRNGEEAYQINDLEQLEVDVS